MTKREDIESNNSNTRIIFFHNKFLLGGIEILEAKVIDELLGLGYDVVVPSLENEPFNEVYAGISGAFARFSHRGYADFIARAPELISDRVEKVIFASLHPAAAMVCEAAGRNIQRECKKNIPVHHFHWVSHSRAFFFKKNVLVNILFREFFKVLPIRSTYFMNDAALLAHQLFWSRSVASHPILRIVGRNAKTKNSLSKSIDQTLMETHESKLRIVSVGRLVPFKAYNVSAPIVIRQLRDVGIEASWDIWGNGPDEAVIIANAQRHGVVDNVRLRGEISHELFDETVSSYDVFVGMGTSVLEAANTRTPSCVAIENQGDACYGFLHQSPSDSVGDRVDGVIERRLRDVLYDFASLTSEERRKVGEADENATKLRESTLSEFVAAILTADPLKSIKWQERVLFVAVKAYLRQRQRKFRRNLN